MTIPDDFALRDGEDFDVLLTRYWLGESSADERQRIQQWFERHPNHHIQFQRLYQGIEAGLWAPIAQEVAVERTVGILQRVRIVGARDQSPRRYRRGVFSLRYAFAFVVILMLGVVWYQRQSYYLTQTTAQSVYTTGKGERARVTLPDGTSVLLNVASQLQVPEDYGYNNRTVMLIGEALFTVVHNGRVPFTVTTSHSTSRVLGTRFSVRQYQTDTVAVVAVEDGKVAVGSQVLTAGYETSVSALGTRSVRTTDPKRFGFAHGVLFLDSRSLVDAVPELNRWYNADIRLGDSTLITQRIVGSFEVGSITDLIWMLQTAYNVRVVRDGRVLTLYPKR